MMQRFKETGHPIFKSINALSRGILKRKNGREAIHFNTDTSNTELLFRTIHSANKLSVYGAVSHWCEEFGRTPHEKEDTSDKFASKENEEILKMLNPQEVNSLVRTPRNGSPASENGLRESLRNFESLSKTNQFTRICENASFKHRVSAGMRYKTSPDVNDGFGDFTTACRVYAHTPNPDRMQQFQEEPYLDQSSKFTPYNFLAHSWN